MSIKDHLIAEFTLHANDQIAAGQKAYMKDKFEFFGIKSPERRIIQRPFLVKEYLPCKEESFELIRELWEEPQRELQHFAMELLFKYLKQVEVDDIWFVEYLITHKSWWDTVDFLATKSVGFYMKKFPEEQNGIIEKWLTSDNIWLQRTCLLYQLKYKDKLDTERLDQIIVRLNGTKEFFINKAIGWVLREYSKTNPEWVISYVDRTPLHSLSKREALKVINRK